MRATFSFGRIGGVPVGAHWSALVGVIVIGTLLASTVLPELAPGATTLAYGLAGGVGAVALVVSLLAHELAHAVVARRSGLEVRRITLWLLGGVSEFGTQPSRAAVELRVALAGPGVSVALGVVLAASGLDRVRLGCAGAGGGDVVVAGDGERGARGVQPVAGVTAGRWSGAARADLAAQR